MKKLFYNSKIYIDKNHFDEAVLVDGNIVEAIGKSKMLLRAAGGECITFDCGGQTMIPGINDSHIHLMQFGEYLHQAKIDEADSIDEMIEICRSYADKHSNVSARGMHSSGWDQNHFRDGRMPTRHDLDKISTDYPIALERICGHVLTTNTKAIEMLGLTAQSAQYPDGSFLIGEDGYPNGIFVENACFYPKNLIPDFTISERYEIILEAMNYAASHGITSVQSNDVASMPVSIEESFRLFHKLYSSGKAPIRYRHQVNFPSYEEFEKCVEEGEYAHARSLYPENSLLTLGPLKLYKDGSLGSKTALLGKGYLDDSDNHGLEWLKNGEMDKFCRLASDNGIQIITHCIGDKAIEQTLDCYKKVNRNKYGGHNPLRHGVVHCQITDKSLIKRIVDEEILAFVQPIFVSSDIDILTSLVNSELAKSSYAFGTLLREGGIRTSYGTDCPVEDCNPFPNIFCAVTRKKVSETSDECFIPSERVTVEDAIDAYTIAGAYSEFAEKKLGRIKPGYLADFILLDRDIFSCAPDQIKEILPVMTVVDGNIIFFERIPPLHQD